MLIKVGDNVVLNMVAVSSVVIDIHEESKKGKALFSGTTIEKTFAVVINYQDQNNKDNKYTLYGFKEYERASKIRDNVISQIKELEIERISTELENAIRRN